jgi:hypothetical protein
MLPDDRRDFLRGGVAAKSRHQIILLFKQTRAKTLPVGAARSGVNNRRSGVLLPQQNAGDWATRKNEENLCSDLAGRENAEVKNDDKQDCKPVQRFAWFIGSTVSATD